MADLDYDGPDARPPADEYRQHVPPVAVRLIGRERDVIAALDVIRRVFGVSDVSHLITARGGQVRLYLTITRDFPYSGGTK